MDDNIESAKKAITNLFITKKNVNEKKGKGMSAYKQPLMNKRRINNIQKPEPILESTPEPKTKKPPAKVKSEIIMKASSMSKNKEDNNRPAVDTDMSIKKGITDKMKRALKKSVINSLENELKGSGFIVDSDTSSDEEIITIKRRGRPKKKTI